MKIPLEITYRNVERTPLIHNLILEKAAKLQRICSYIASCRVAIEKNQKHQRGGQPYRVRLDIKVPPSHEFAIREEQSEGYSHAELATIIKDAFLAADRKLETLKEKQRGFVKKYRGRKK